MKHRHAVSLAAIAMCGLVLTAAPAKAVDSFFDVFTELPVFTPPHPSQPLVMVAGTMNAGGFVPTQQVEIEMVALSLNGLPPGKPFVCRGLMSGGGTQGGPPAIDSFFDIFYEIDLMPPINVRDRHATHMVHPPGTPPGTWRLLPINPNAPPGSIGTFFDIFIDEDFFDIEYRVADDTGVHTYHTHGTSPSGRASFFDVFVELRNPNPYPNGTVDSFFDVFVDLQVSGPQSGAPDVSEHTTGTYEGGATASTRDSWGAIKALYR